MTAMTLLLWGFALLQQHSQAQQRKPCAMAFVYGRGTTQTRRISAHKSTRDNIKAITVSWIKKLITCRTKWHAVPHLSSKYVRWCTVCPWVMQDKNLTHRPDNNTHVGRVWTMLCCSLNGMLSQTWITPRTLSVAKMSTWGDFSSSSTTPSCLLIVALCKSENPS